MKKALLSIMSVIFLISVLCSCGLEADKPSKETSQSSKAETADKDIFSLNETAVFNNLKFTANEIKESKGNQLFTPDDGNVFVGINFTVENISDEEQNISSMLLFAAYSDDIKCDYSVTAACAFESTLDGSISSGKKMNGWYAVEIPTDWQTLEIHVSSNYLSSNSAKFVFTK